jgi:hypothetical protein
MPHHDYTAQQALGLLMKLIAERNRDLATQIQTVVDTGRDVEETEPSMGRRKRSRSYRKTVPYTFEEALQVALSALRAYFIEQPLLLNSCLQNFDGTLIEARGQRPPHSRQWDATKDINVAQNSLGQSKEVEIELRTETQLSKLERETFPLHVVDPTQIGEEQKNLAILSGLFDFRTE